MIPAELIARKRDGGELTEREIHNWIHRYTQGELPDYQMSALAMAIIFQGMTQQETVALTQALLDSGTTLRWTNPSPKVDKHSTGGVGDKVSLILAPLLACCGVRVPMLSGRGLGLTGGTLDKLESIAGFRTDLTVREIETQIADVGCVVTGASDDLAPADRKLYALRDVTATVPSRPLMVASILSKKLAEGLDSLVLDVKVGSGAFMKSRTEAESLARDLVSVAQQLGLPTTAVLSNMDQPLGQAIGNAVEVQEAIQVLQGQGPPDVTELTLHLSSVLLVNVGIARDRSHARELLLAHLASGAAYEKFQQMVSAQGGRLASLQSIPVKEVLASTAGYVHTIDCARLGAAVIEMGGGRHVVGEPIDHRVGLQCLVQIGDAVVKGQPLLRVFVAGEFPTDELADVLTIAESPIAKQALVLTELSAKDGLGFDEGSRGK